MTSPPLTSEPASLEQVTGAVAVAVPMATAVTSTRSCKAKARALVHKYAVFGTAWAVLPLPIATSAGLTALETHMIYWIARLYGESPTSKDLLMIAGGIELASVALKTVAVEGANFIPVIGWGFKGAVAGSAIEGIGALIINHFEQKYPGKTY